MEEDIGTTIVREHIVAINRLVEAHPEDGIIWDDDRLTVERRNETVFYTRKSACFRLPLRYEPKRKGK